METNKPQSVCADCKYFKGDPDNTYGDQYCMHEDNRYEEITDPITGKVHWGGDGPFGLCCELNETGKCESFSVGLGLLHSARDDRIERYNRRAGIPVWGDKLSDMTHTRPNLSTVWAIIRDWYMTSDSGY